MITWAVAPLPVPEIVTDGGGCEKPLPGVLTVQLVTPVARTGVPSVMPEAEADGADVKPSPPSTIAMLLTDPQ